MFEKQWHELSREQKDLYVSLLWEDNYTAQAIADFFGAGIGAIVGHRSRYLRSLPTDRTVVSGEVNPERFQNLLEIHAMREMEKRGVAAVMPVTQSAAPENPIRSSDGIANFSVAKIVVVPSKAAVKPEVLTCQWPMATGPSLKEPKLCGKDAVKGHKLCEEHLRLVPKRIPV